MPLGTIILVLTIYTLCAARVTRAVNYDTLLDPVRLWIARRAATAAEKASNEFADAEQHKLAAKRYNRWTTLTDFLSCPWCVGFWASLALAPAAIEVIGWPYWTLAALPFAASHLIGIGDRLVSEDVDIVGGA